MSVRSPKPEPNSFSLDDFYAKRSAAPSGETIPRFAVRAADAESTTTTTSAGVTRAALPPWHLRREARGPLPKLGGPVMVVRAVCLAWQGSPCWTCSEKCPVVGAISLDAGRPIVDVTRCDGCGECVAACPAPHNALKLAELARGPKSETETKE